MKPFAALLLAFAACVLAPATAAAHSLVRVGGGQVSYLAADATSLNTLTVRLSGGEIELRDPTVDGGSDPGPCRPGEVSDDANFWIVQVFCKRAGIESLRIDLGEREDKATVSAPIPVTMLGGNGADTLRGGTAADTVSGGAGNDKLDGGSGDDRIDGGLGADGVTGGAGADRIVTADGLVDRIACGDGGDRVEADTVDEVDGDCEDVVRTPVAPPSEQSAGSDGTPPRVAAGGSTLQRLSRDGRIEIAATSSERGQLAASGVLSVGDLDLPVRSDRRRVSVGGAGVTLTIRLRGRALRSARRALARGRRVSMRIVVVGTDTAGNSAATRPLRIQMRR